MRAVVLFLFLVGALCAEGPLPRTIIALYDGQIDSDITYSLPHRYAEMPLNHLGLKVEYYDVREKLPSLNRDGVLGVLIWWRGETKISHWKEYRDWLAEAADLKKKIVILGSLGAAELEEGPNNTTQKIWGYLGIQDSEDWLINPFEEGSEYFRDDLYAFEIEEDIYPESLNKKTVRDDRVKVHLSIREKNRDKPFVLATTHPNGGYIGDGCVIKERYLEVLGHDLRSWVVNPFTFFRQAFQTDSLPKPDTTTLCGRRMYYSHLDGDGWNNISEIGLYRKKKKSAIEVLYHEVFVPYHDLPITIGPISAELDRDWYGSKASVLIAKEIFKLPNVEIGSHTFSHPFQWGYYEDYSRSDEVNYFGICSGGDVRSAWNRLENNFCEVPKGKKSVKLRLNKDYKTPRAFALKPFDLKQEIFGSVDFASDLGPGGKNAKILLWSGDCRPYERAIAYTREKGVRNLNGGDTRFDLDFDSYAWVTALSRQVGKERQIYSSFSNENTYTDLWGGNYGGFIKVIQTIHNTEVPIRTKPINLYYHSYTGQKFPSLRALKASLDKVRTLSVCPVAASHFAAVVDSFFDVKFHLVGDLVWRVEDRGDLETLRFDNASFLGVDFSRSNGILGQKHHQGSLYVALDPGVKSPLVALKETAAIYEEPQESVPYLVGSRWPVTQFKRENDGSFAFQAEGFGPCEMQWRVSASLKYYGMVGDKKISLINTNGNLHIYWDQENQPLSMSVVVDDT